MIQKKSLVISAKALLAFLPLFLLVTLNSCKKETVSEVQQKEEKVTATEVQQTEFTLEEALKVSEVNLWKRLTTNTTASSCDGVHFTYEGEDGPEHWGELCKAWAACGEGLAQSPVNIGNVIKDRSLRPLDFRWCSTRTNIVNNGHTIQFNVDAGSKLIANGKSYDLLQFHYHHVSEHTIHGKHYPLEVHYVHSAADGKLAVVGIMFREGKPNSLFNRFLAHFPTSMKTYSSPESIDLRCLLPEDLKYYNYHGSLTTPACSETVNWLVLKGTVEASEEQIEQLKHIIHNNNRPLQQLNGRVIHMSTGGRDDD